jgi:hypothetical protein
VRRKKRKQIERSSLPFFFNARALFPHVRALFPHAFLTLRRGRFLSFPLFLRYGAFDLLGARDLALEAARNVNNWIAKLEPWKMKDDQVPTVERRRLRFRPSAGGGVFVLVYLGLQVFGVRWV